MRFPRTPFLLALALVGSLLLAQEPVSGPPKDAKRMPARRTFDPDADEAVRPAQHVVPADLPGEVITGPLILPAQYTEPAGELPTPTVTLNIEGGDVAPTGQPVVYKLHVRNMSRARAHNVAVRVIPPKNASKVKYDPVPTHDEAESRWDLKVLEPGQSRTIELAYLPNKDAAEIKVQARLQFDFGRGMITKVSAPALSVKRDGPEAMVVGDTVRHRITVTNTGRVTVREIKVREILGKGLTYEEREVARGTVDGRLTSSIDVQAGERTWTIPALAPGKSETLEYQVKAREAGRVPSAVAVTATDVIKEVKAETEVLTAQLQVHAEGPGNQKGTVNQPAAYKVTVENRGSADLRNVVVRCQFPPDMRVTRATSGSQPFRDSVQWIFRELKKGDSRELTVSLTTASPGTRTVHFSARAEKGKEQKTVVKTEFAGVSGLDWDVEAPGVVAAGKPVTYRVTVANRGTATGRARLQVDLPPALDLRETIPKTATLGVGQNAKEVRFPAYDFPAGKKTTFTIVVAARSAGEAKTIFSLFEEGRPEKREDKVTTVTGSDTRSPAGPPPARGVDPTKVGLGPRP